MKKLSFLLAVAMLASLFSCTSVIYGESTENTAAEEETETDNPSSGTAFKGMWLSQFDLGGVYQKNGVQRDEAEFRTLIGKVTDNIKNSGFDSVIVQVRPYCDSFYPSELFPPSRIAVGKYGNDFSYDPFAVILETAKKKGLSVHAWINPLRGMEEKYISSVPEKYKIRQWYDEKKPFVHILSGRLYLDPAYPEVREIIADGVAEIVEHYDVDGVHMDDYFYPTTQKSFDEKAFSASGETDLAAFRRNNISLTVKGIYGAVKSSRDIPFGISPAGNINSVYAEDYADIYLWCSENGYIDYIAPQVYFGLKHQNWDFVSTSEKWSDIIKNPDIALYIGMTFGKVVSGVDNYAGTGKYEWSEDKFIMKRCLEKTEDIKNCKGVIVFSYQYFYDAVTNSVNEKTLEEKTAFCDVLKEAEWS